MGFLVFSIGDFLSVYARFVSFMTSVKINGNDGQVPEIRFIPFRSFLQMLFCILDR